MRRQGAAVAASVALEAAASVALAAAWGNPFNSFDRGAHRPFDERTLWNIGSGLPRQSVLMFTARITLAHFSVSSANIFPNSFGDSGIGTLPLDGGRRCLERVA